MTVYADIEGFRFSGSKLQAPGHDELLLSDEFGAQELIADDGDALYSFPPGTTEREILRPRAAIQPLNGGAESGAAHVTESRSNVL
jgi:hypothetical protein